MKEQLSRVNRAVWFFRCLRIAAALCLCASLLTAQSGGIAPRNKDQMALETLEAALKAMGGADKIDGIKSLIIKGTGTSKTADNVRTYDFEFRILLPNDYLRISRFPDRTNYSGISRGNLIPQPRAFPSDFYRDVITMREKVEWSIFLIGACMKSGQLRLTLSSRSKPGVFDLSMPEGVIGEVEFDSKTGYLSVVRFREPAELGLGGGTTVYQFSNDRFSAGGIMFPRIYTITGAKSESEYRIEEVLINPELSRKDFEIPK